MTTATKPRTPRTRKTRVETLPPTPDCSICGRALGWHDTAYGAATSHRCKRCKRTAEKAALRGTMVPRERMPHAPMAYGSERTRTMTGAGHKRMKPVREPDQRRPWKHPPAMIGAVRNRALARVGKRGAA
jgi:hypothetical protein